MPTGIITPVRVNELIPRECFCMLYAQRVHLFGMRACCACYLLPAPYITMCDFCIKSHTIQLSMVYIVFFFIRFPDYVCLDEPCGEYSDSDLFPCENTCIPTDQICHLSGRCSPSMCGKECLDLAAVCDGKVDCEDGTDEAACDDNAGSWMCNGNIQSRSIPC